MSAETAMSVLFGGLITLVVSWVFYKRAGDQLRDESRELRIRTERVQQVVNVLGDAMEEAGWAELERDAYRNIIRLKFRKVQGAAQGTAATIGDLTTDPLPLAVRRTWAARWLRPGRR